MFQVSNSKIKTWRNCKKQYDYKYVQKLKVRRKASPLIRGSIIHEMIEAQISGKKPFKALASAATEYDKLFEEEKEFYGDMIDEIRRTMEGYFEFYKDDPLQYVKHRKKVAEHFFEVKLTDSINLIGYIDTIAIDPDGLLCVVDHKTSKSIPQTELKPSDVQGALYSFALPQMGFEFPDAFIWNYIRSKPPSIPEVLKNGSMTRRSIDTVWPVYKEALLKNKLNPKDYKDVEQRLSNKYEEFYVRQRLPLNKVVIQNILEDAQITAREIKRKAGVDNTRHLGRHCEFCDYKPLCLSELRGLDMEYMRKTDYTYREDDNSEEKVKTKSAD